LRAKGGVWHKKDREKGIVPHSSIDTTAHWSKSGYHGWWYGFKLHLAATLGSLGIPLAADLTPANVSTSKKAPDVRYNRVAQLGRNIKEHEWIIRLAWTISKCETSI
jgi:hypothetical protein